MDNKIFLTRPNEESAATEDDIKRFEKSALVEFAKGNEVYLIEKFPTKFFGHATKIRLEKVSKPVSHLSEESNARLFKVVSAHSIYE